MSNIVTHLGDNMNWVAAKNAHNTFTITFTSSGAFDISTYDFVLNIRKDRVTTNALQLTEASGITNGGATGILTIDLTQTQASTTLPGDTYFYEIVYTKDSKVYPLIQGVLTLSNQTNPASTTTSVSLSVSLAGTSVSAAVTLAGSTGSISLDAFATALTFNHDKDLTTISGGTTTFTLAASGHLNGVGIVARINLPIAVNFPAGFEASEGSSSISTTNMNLILFRYWEDYDGAGNDKVLYLIKNQTAI